MPVENISLNQLFFHLLFSLFFLLLLIHPFSDQKRFSNSFYEFHPAFSLFFVCLIQLKTEDIAKSPCTYVGKARQLNLVSGELTHMGNSPSTRQPFDFFKTPKRTPLLSPKEQNPPPLQQNCKVTLYFWR